MSTLQRMAVRLACLHTGERYVTKALFVGLDARVVNTHQHALHRAGFVRRVGHCEWEILRDVPAGLRYGQLRREQYLASRRK
jgi:hypothetical protein